MKRHLRLPFAILVLVGLVVIAIDLHSVLKLSVHPGSDNRLALESGEPGLVLSAAERQAGLNYALALEKVIRIMPPLVGKPDSNNSLVKQTAEMFEKANTKELQPLLDPLGTSSDAARLREAARKVQEAVSYCYHADLKERRDAQAESEILRLLRLTSPPQTTNEAANGILKLCGDFAGLCDPDFSKKQGR